MAVSKIVVNGITQMDVTQDTVVADKLAEGYTAHRNDGVQITGTMSGGGGGGGGLTKYTSTNVTVANDQVTIALLGRFLQRWPFRVAIAPWNLWTGNGRKDGMEGSVEPGGRGPLHGSFYCKGAIRRGSD